MVDRKFSHVYTYIHTHTLTHSHTHTLTGLSSTSSRDSPPRVVVVHNARITDHDYVSIKSRESPAPKGIYICNLSNSTEGRSVQNPYVIGPHPLHQSASSSELLADGSMNISGSKTMKPENEPIYNNIKSKVQTL